MYACYTVKPCFTNTRLTQTPHYYGQFVLSLGEESPVFSLNSICLIQTTCTVDVDTEGALVSVHINWVSILSKFNGCLENKDPLRPPTKGL